MVNTNPNQETRTILADLTADEIELTEAESKSVLGGQPPDGETDCEKDTKITNHYSCDN